MRIWVARPEPGATRTAAALRALGHEPLIAPLFEILASDVPPPEGDYAGILLTSGQGVPALDRAGIGRNEQIFAVGDRTAQTARDAGFRNVTTAGGDAADLARVVRSNLRKGASLLLAAGENRKAEPAETLRAAGYDVRIWTAYTARPVMKLPQTVVCALSDHDSEDVLAAALHFSRRGAQTALNLTRAAGLGGAFRALKHYCLSADVALPLVEVGIPAHFVPTRPTERALLDGLGHSAE